MINVQLYGLKPGLLNMIIYSDNSDEWDNHLLNVINSDSDSLFQ